MFDTHCHLNFKRFKKNVAEVIDRAHTSGVTHMVVPGTDVKRSRTAVEIAQENDGIYAAVGIHPHHAYKLITSEIATVESELNDIKDLLSEPSVVAVGEVGMDRHVYENTKYEQYAVDDRFISTQQQLLRAQIKLAIQHNKSLILHNREATDDLISLLKEVWDGSLERRAVLHCCEADERLLSVAKDHHMFIGVDGDVTYDKVKQDFIRHVPIEMLVLETDSPYILPEPLLSQKKYPNEPANLPLIAASVAKLKDLSVDEVKRITTQNGMRLFGME